MYANYKILKWKFLKVIIMEPGSWCMQFDFLVHVHLLDYSETTFEESEQQTQVRSSQAQENEFYQSPALPIKS